MDYKEVVFKKGTKVLFIAPHPDDESITSSGILQRAVKSGSKVNMIFVTNGEANHWCQRFTEKKLFITQKDKLRLVINVNYYFPSTTIISPFVFE